MFSNFLADYSQLFRGLSFTEPTWDLFLLVFFVVGSLLYGFSLGRDRIIMIMVSIYMALVAVSRLPFDPNSAGEISLQSGFVVKFSTFVGLFIILFFLLTRSALHRAMSGSDGGGKWWQVLMLSFAQIGLVLSVVLSFLPPIATQKFASITRIIFVSRVGQFVWVMLPIVALLLIGYANTRRRSSDDI